jgi:hypothetical protein
VATSRLPLSVLRRLDRALLYSTLDQVLKRSVRIASCETAFDDVFQGISAVTPLPAATGFQEEETAFGALVKYGLLDLTLGLTASPYALKPARLGTLRSVGLVDGYSGEQSPDWDDPFLTELASDAEAGDMYLKVLLQSPHIAVERETAQEIMHRVENGLPGNFWPHSFVIEDACVTNAKSIWMAKHLYM